MAAARALGSAPGCEESPICKALSGLTSGQQRLEQELKAVSQNLAELSEQLRCRPSFEVGCLRSLGRKPDETTSTRELLEVCKTMSAMAVANSTSIAGETASAGTPSPPAVKGLSTLTKHSSLPMSRSGPDLVLPLKPPESLPPNWPACLEGRHAVQDEAGFILQCEEDVRLNRIRAWTSTESHMDFEEEDTRQLLAWDPNSGSATFYGVLTLLQLLTDAFLVPWALAWDAPMTGALLVLSLSSCLFWTFDLVLGFFVGFYERQRLELRLRRTAWHHLKTWFFLDFVVVFSDWLNLIPSIASGRFKAGAGSISRVLRIAKIAKLLRILGLLRMMKLAKIFEDYIEGGFFSDLARLGMRLLQFLVAVVWVSHLVTCMWFRIGLLEGDTGMNWVHTAFAQETPHGLVEVGFLQFGPWHQYVTAFHWAIAQLSLGATEITCHNSAERSFNCVCILLGFLGGSTLISSLSATMVDYQSAQRERQEKLVKLRRYLRENRGVVSKGTAQLVQQQAAERLRVSDRLQEGEVQVLELVPSSLRRQLRYEVYQTMLSSHGLLRLWAKIDQTTLMKACLEALEYLHYRPGDDVFSAGARTDTAFHLGRGQLQYIKEPESAPVHLRENIPVAKGSWLAEGSLWCHWTHVGTARAGAVCEVLLLPAQTAVLMAQQRPEVRHLTFAYAARYLQQLHAARPPANLFPDDLTVPETNFEELFTSLTAARSASLLLVTQAPGTQGQKRLLRHEVGAGASCVAVQVDGSLERITCWIEAHIQDARKCTLVQVGKSGPGGFAPACELPRTRLAQGERAEEALKRLLLRLGVRESFGQQGLLERRVERQKGEEIGVPAKVVRRLHRFHLAAGDALSLRPVATSAESFEGTTLSEEGGYLREHFLEVFVDSEQQGIYSWLSFALFEHLRTPAGERELQMWFEALNMKQAACREEPWPIKESL